MDTKPLTPVQLAALGGGVFDVPPRTRNLMLIAGAAGVVLVLAGSLIGRTAATLPVDKVIHFSGYMTLGLVFVVGLRPRLFVPALLALAGVGLAVEFVQPMNGRTFDWSDAAANTFGVVVGGAAGLLARSAVAYVRKELAVVDTRRRTVHFRAGDVILRQGEAVREFLVIARGEVALLRETDGATVELGRARPGQPVGVVAVVRGEPQPWTARATAKGSFIRMSLDDVFESAGGAGQPAAAVLAGMAEGLRSLGDRLARCQCGAAHLGPTPHPAAEAHTIP